MSDDVIIDKIHATQATDFDTSVAAMRILKAAKVSDAVIRSMIDPHPSGSTISSAPMVSNLDNALPQEVGVYVMLHGDAFMGERPVGYHEAQPAPGGPARTLQDDGREVVGENHRVGTSFGETLIPQIEAGRPIALTTLPRICEALDVKLTTMLEGLDRGSKN